MAKIDWDSPESKNFVPPGEYELTIQTLEWAHFEKSGSNGVKLWTKTERDTSVNENFVLAPTGGSAPHPIAIARFKSLMAALGEPPLQPFDPSLQAEVDAFGLAIKAYEGQRFRAVLKVTSDGYGDKNEIKKFIVPKTGASKPTPGTTPAPGAPPVAEEKSKF